MKRTQLYLEEETLNLLKSLSRKQMTSVSELVRQAVKKVYLAQRPGNADKILEMAAGVWKDRDDLPSTEEYIRQMRLDSRSNRYGLKS